MLFDLKPKEMIKDFFNYKEELDLFVRGLTDKSTRMIVIRGLRRTGKSSLLRVGLHKSKVRHVLIDARELTTLSRKSFESKLLGELKSIKGIPASLLEKIESVEMGIKISIKNEETIWNTLKEVNPTIAVDEVQMLKGTGVEAFFAAAFDNTDCKIVLTGSEVGVLDAFVGKENPKAPLFGRVFSEIKMHVLSPQKSKEFLATGFKEAGKEISEEKMIEVRKELGGIVGWLTIFGNTSLSLDTEEALKKSVKKGSMLAYSELESFLDMRKPAKKRYLALLQLLAEREMRWVDLKRSLQIELKEGISDPQFSNYLNSLKDYGFVILLDSIYSIPDPLLRKALRGGVSGL